MKVAYNNQYGGFSISGKAIERLIELGSKEAVLVKELYGSDLERGCSIDFREARIKRHDPLLIQVIEELGKKANGSCCTINIDDIDDYAHYSISEFDGRETVEVHYLSCHCCSK